jgi:hypothetical protein
LSNDQLQRVPNEKGLSEIDNDKDHANDKREDQRRLDRSRSALRAVKPAFSARGGWTRHWLRSTVLAFTEGGKGQVAETNGV